MNITEYLAAHTKRGACCCGRCVHAPSNPENHQPEGHTSDVFFFKVSAHDNPKPGELREAIKQHQGYYGECDPLDGKEHNYMELGGWIGDQGQALTLMGLGELLGLWKVVTPKSLGIEGDLAQRMAGMGFVSTMPVSLESKPNGIGVPASPQSPSLPVAEEPNKDTNKDCPIIDF